MDDTVGVKDQIVGDLAGICLVRGETGVIFGWGSTIEGRAVVVNGKRTSLIL